MKPTTNQELVKVLDMKRIALGEKQLKRCLAILTHRHRLIFRSLDGRGLGVATQTVIHTRNLLLRIFGQMMMTFRSMTIVLREHILIRTKLDAFVILLTF